MTLDEMLDAYDADHQNAHNRRLHLVGITLIGAGVASVFAAPVAGASLFALGWGAQLLGHAIEGKPPSLTRDPRFMAVGAVWYVRALRRKLRSVRSSAQGSRRGGPPRPNAPRA